MKNKEDNTVATLEKGKITVYSEETKHLFSKEDQGFFENFDKRMPKFSKYFVWQKRKVIEKTKQEYAKKSTTSLRQAIIQVLSTMPDFLPAENLLQVVGYITQTWEESLKNDTLS